MAVCTATFETGVDGNDVLTGDAGSATAWDVRAVTGGSIVYDDAHAHGGSLAGKFTYSGSSSSTALRWTTAFGTITDHYGRIYLYATAYQDSTPDASPVNFKTGASTVMAAIKVGSDGVLSAQDATFSVTTGTVPIALNQWVRIEWHIVHNTSTGSVEIKLFNDAESTTPDDTITWTNRNTGSSADTAEFGTAQITSSTWVFWLDDIVANATDWPGPAEEPVETWWLATL